MSRRPGWHSLMHTCEIHMVHSMHKKSATLLAPDCLRGQLYCRLSMNAGHGLEKFRCCIRQVVADRLLVLRDATPPSPTDGLWQYKRQTMRLSLSRGRALIPKRLSILALPNGNWQRRDKIEVYIGEGVPINRSNLAKVVGEACCRILAGQNFSAHAAHRWTGACEALDEMILLESVCGIGSHAFKLWCDQATAKSRAAAARAKQNAFGKAKAKPKPTPKPKAKAVAAGGPAPAPAPPLAMVPFVPAEPAPPAGDAEGGGDHAAEQAKFHAGAKKFFDSKPLGRLLVLRQVLEPHRVLMRAQLFLGSSEWESAQRALEAKALNSGDPSVEQRTYDFVVGAGEELEKEFMARSALLMHHVELWEHLMPRAFHNLEHRDLAFRLLSASDCLVVESLVDAHSKYPTNMFGILKSAAHCDGILNDPPCIRDSFTNDALVKKFKGTVSGLQSEECKAQVRLLARLGRSHMGKIEAQHAQIRRRLVARGCQTWKPSVEAVPAEFHQCRDQRFGAVDGDDAEHPSAENALDAGGGKVDGRAATPWQLYVADRNEKCGGKFLDNALLSRDYRALPQHKCSASSTFPTLRSLPETLGHLRAASGRQPKIARGLRVRRRNKLPRTVRCWRSGCKGSKASPHSVERSS